MSDLNSFLSSCSSSQGERTSSRSFASIARTLRRAGWTTSTSISPSSRPWQSAMRCLPTFFSRLRTTRPCRRAKSATEPLKASDSSPWTARPGAPARGVPVAGDGTIRVVGRRAVAAVVPLRPLWARRRSPPPPHLPPDPASPIGAGGGQPPPWPGRGGLPGGAYPAVVSGIRKRLIAWAWPVVSSTSTTAAARRTSRLATSKGAGVWRRKRFRTLSARMPMIDS
jgi:hypothetical protein